MDWSMDFLKDLTIELDICRGGKTICIAPTWIGCVGIFTALDILNIHINILHKQIWISTSMNQIKIVWIL